MLRKTILITYSSRTGNTRKVAEAIASALNGDVTVVPVEEAPEPTDFDRLLHGFWVNGATADEASLEYLRLIRGQSIGLFGTMGAHPDSAYGRSIHLRLKNELKRNGNRLDGWFLCAGEIDAKLIAWMETLPPGHSQYPTPERRQNWADAMGHPDQPDLSRAVAAFAAGRKMG